MLLTLLSTINIIALFLLLVFSFYRLYLTLLYERTRGKIPVPKGRFEELPKVTVQLPVYNEMYVVERLIDSVCSIDYPRDRFEVQVLDDSKDETTEIIERAVARWKDLGTDIIHIRRESRKGFKAGALNYGLAKAKGDFILIFDADFIPAPNILNRTIHYFTDPTVGMTQCRWGHINRRQSLLTYLQSILLDAHFIIEQSARSATGQFFNFNGTAGIWRKETIERTGGWDERTLVEDIDLSYRAQLDGWRFVYLADTMVPAELPPDILSFKVQQHRWAKGAIQTLNKLFFRLMKSPIPLGLKLHALFHLASNYTFPLLLLVSILLPRTLSYQSPSGGYNQFLTSGLDFVLFVAGLLPIFIFYAVTIYETGAGLLRSILYVPLALCLGSGICLSNSFAVWGAVLKRPSIFIRTPKISELYAKGLTGNSGYSSKAGPALIFETILAIYFGLSFGIAIWREQFYIASFLFLFFAGYLGVALSSISQQISSFSAALKISRE